MSVYHAGSGLESTTMFKRVSILALFLLVACQPPSSGVPQPEPEKPGLPSWNVGPALQVIEAFVADVTNPGSSNFVPVNERIAVFDNDGTLWAEQPLYFQVLFAIDQVIRMAPRASRVAGARTIQQHPRWRYRRCTRWR